MTRKQASAIIGLLVALLVVQIGQAVYFGARLRHVERSAESAEAAAIDTVELVKDRPAEPSSDGLLLARLRR